MKKGIGVLVIFILINFGLCWSQNNEIKSKTLHPDKEISEKAKSESKNIEKIAPTLSDSTHITTIKFTEEEGLKIKGKIPRPKALVTLPKKNIRPAGDTFAPDIEKLLDQLLKIKR